MKRTGKLLGMPYDLRMPNWVRIKSRVWNADDRRMLTPKSFGWGYTINFYEIARRLHLIRRKPQS